MLNSRVEKSDGKVGLYKIYTPVGRLEKKSSFQIFKRQGLERGVGVVDDARLGQ